MARVVHKHMKGEGLKSSLGLIEMNDEGVVQSVGGEKVTNEIAQSLVSLYGSSFHFDARPDDIGEPDGDEAPVKSTRRRIAAKKPTTGKNKVARKKRVASSK